MSSTDAGFPPGISAGSLGRRVVATIIDALPAAVLAGAGSGIGAAVGRTDLLVVLSIVGALLAVGWWVLVWRWQGTRGASPGQRVMRLELVAIENGRPIGFGRAAVRGLILLALSATSVGLVVMLVLLLLDPRRQGWHDRASRSVVITARGGAGGGPGHADAAGDRAGTVPGAVGAPPAAAPVGLPPSLSGQRSPYAPDQGHGDGGRPPGTPTSADGPPGYGGAPFGQPAQSQTPPGVWPPRRPVGEPPFGQPAPGQGQPDQPYGHQGFGTQPSGQPGWGAQGTGGPPSASSAPSAPGPVLDRLPDFGAAEPAEEMESTRLVPRGGGQPRRPDQGWLVVLGDGRQIAVESLVLLGRNPEPRTGEEGAELVKVADSSRTVSKTHIAIGVDQRGAYVMDRGSTNGSAIATSSGSFEPCAPGQVVRVRENQVVSFGEQRFEVRRSYPAADAGR